MCAARAGKTHSLRKSFCAEYCPQLGAYPQSRPTTASQISVNIRRIKPRRTQYEQISSGLSLEADITQYSRDVSKVPLGDKGHHQSSIEVVAGVEDNKVRLLARDAVAVTMDEEKSSDQLTGKARSNSDFLRKRREQVKCKRVPMR
jgi:hypothetical protein